MAENYKKHKVYFYQIVPKIPVTDSRCVKDFKSHYSRAFSFTKSPKAYDVGDGSVSAVNPKKLKNGLIGGAIIYTLETDIPPKYNPEKQMPAEIELDGFSGLGYDSAYVYDPELMVLAIENRRPGATLNNIRNLIFANKNDIPGFEYKPVAYSDSYQKFLQSNGVRSMKMKMLRIPTQTDKKDYQRGVKEVKDLVDDIEGAQITIHITSGKQKEKFLNKEHIQDWAQQALSKVGLSHPVESFELKIEDVDSEKIIPIDLITGRIFEFTKIEKVRLIDRFSIGEKIEQIEEHLKDKQKAIKEFIND